MASVLKSQQKIYFYFYKNIFTRYHRGINWKTIIFHQTYITHHKWTQHRENIVENNNNKSLLISNWSILCELYLISFQAKENATHNDKKTFFCEMNDWNHLFYKMLSLKYRIVGLCFFLILDNCCKLEWDSRETKHGNRFNMASNRQQHQKPTTYGLSFVDTGRIK